MAFSISKEKVQEIVSQAERAKSRAATLREKAEQITDQFVQTSEEGITAFLLGLSQGRYGGVEIVGMPLELVTAIGAHLAGFSGVLGRAAPHLHAVGDGALCTYLSTLGRGVGVSIKQKAEQAALPKATTKGEGMTDEEVAALAK